MFTFRHSVPVRCDDSAFDEFCKTFDRHYPRLAGTHHSARFLCGDGITVGSILEAEETLDGRRRHGRIRVERVNPGARVDYVATFPRSIIGLRFALELEKPEHPGAPGAFTIHLCAGSTPIFGPLAIAIARGRLTRLEPLLREHLHEVALNSATIMEELTCGHQHVHPAVPMVG